MRLIYVLLTFLLLQNISFADDLLVKNGIITKGEKPTLIGKDFGFSEGALWMDGKFYFTDIPKNIIYVYDKTDGLKSFVKPSGFTIGMAKYDKNHIVLVRDVGDVALLDVKTKKITSLVNSFEGKRLNAPNDVAIFPNGDIYFTDPNFKKKPAHKNQITFSGVYKLTPKGKLTLLTKKLILPNGIAFSNDFKKLYVSNSKDGSIYSFDVDKNGDTSNFKLFINQTKALNQKSFADGMGVDKNGNIWSVSGKGMSVYSKSGKYLGSLELSSIPSNISFDEENAYITARDKVFVIRLK